VSCDDVHPNPLGVVAAPVVSHYAPDSTVALALLLLLVVRVSRSFSHFADPVLTRFPDFLRASVPDRAPPLAWPSSPLWIDLSGPALPQGPACCGRNRVRRALGCSSPLDAPLEHAGTPFWYSLPLPDGAGPVLFNRDGTLGIEVESRKAPLETIAIGHAENRRAPRFSLLPKVNFRQWYLYCCGGYPDGLSSGIGVCKFLSQRY